jgi:hypothetical protein
MHRCLQLGMRENPASDRRHDSRSPMNDLADETSAGEVELYKRAPSQGLDDYDAGVSGIRYAARCHGHTGNGGHRSGFAKLEIIGLEEELSTTRQDD